MNYSVLQIKNYRLFGVPLVSFLFILFHTNLVTAQVTTDTLKNNDTLTKLPFAIADEKKLSDEDLKNKKEGVSFTGVPDLSSDPINGFGYGGEGTMFFNGKRKDPFFAYTPYRAKMDLALFNTTRNEKEANLVVDVPYIFNTKWRLRVVGEYTINPNPLYFGITQNSLRGLGYPSYTDYKNSLTGPNAFYNDYSIQQQVLNVSMERSFLDGIFRTLVGGEVGQVNITLPGGNSLLKNDFTQQKVVGIGTSLVNIFQLGLIYDTRDLEADPGHGIFAELTNELSLKAFGSGYNFNKVFFHFNLYQNLLPKHPKMLILAIRIAGGYTAGGAPFFEYQDEWSSEGSIEGLGGPSTLRGYKQSRFVAPVITFNNIELRYRFAETDFLKQHFSFGLVPFVDFGGVWDKLSSLNQFNNYRMSEGGGLRIGWNVNTILRFDYAISNEDQQFFFNLAQMF